MKKGFRKFWRGRCCGPFWNGSLFILDMMGNDYNKNMTRSHHWYLSMQLCTYIVKYWLFSTFNSYKYNNRIFILFLHNLFIHCKRIFTVNLNTYTCHCGRYYYLYLYLFETCNIPEQRHSEFRYIYLHNYLQILQYTCTIHNFCDLQ